MSAGGGGADPWRPTVVDVEGRFISATNFTLLGTTDDGTKVVYKPIAGQRPLWDFDAATLPRREVLTYETSARMGLGLVPETVMGDGPHGPGSVQRFVDADADLDVLSLVNAADPVLWAVAALDVVTNNADRKLGHLLRSGGRLIAIDHGLTFHADDKLRTVIWCFAGLPWPEWLSEAALVFDESLALTPEPFASTLQPGEFTALRARIRSVVGGMHPLPPDDRPAVPWPAY